MPDQFDKKHIITSEHWNVDPPDVLVVACSDGRLQFSIDQFINIELGIRHYDRMYMPGGLGGLVPAGGEFLRADNYRQDLYFLLKAHDIDRLILLAHGADNDGPVAANCAHYRRLMPKSSSQEIRDQQIEDVREFLQTAEPHLKKVHVSSYLAEVMEDLTVSYVQIV